MAKPEILEMVRALPTFSSLSEDHLKEVADHLEMERYSPGEVVFKEGQTGHNMFFIAQGRIDIQKGLGDAEPKLLAQLGPGEILGEMALIEEAPRFASAVAGEPTTLLKLHKVRYFDWINARPNDAVAFLVALTQSFSHRLRTTSNELTMLYKLSSVIQKEHESKQAFLDLALPDAMGYVGADWSVGCYLAEEFHDDIERVAAFGPGAAKLPPPPPKDDLPKVKNGWKTPRGFLVRLDEDGGQSGFLYFTADHDVRPSEKFEREPMFTALAHIISATLGNIERNVALRLEARLKAQRGLG